MYFSVLSVYDALKYNNNNTNDNDNNINNNNVQLYNQQLLIIVAALFILNTVYKLPMTPLQLSTSGIPVISLCLCCHPFFCY